MTGRRRWSSGDRRPGAGARVAFVVLAGALGGGEALHAGPAEVAERSATGAAGGAHRARGVRSHASGAGVGAALVGVVGQVGVVGSRVRLARKTDDRLAITGLLSGEDRSVGEGRSSQALLLL